MRHSAPACAVDALRSRSIAHETAPTRRYDFDKHHDGAKQIALNLDVFPYGLESLGLLLFFGNLSAARQGFVKVNDAHKRILARVRQGVAAVDG